MQQMPFVFSTPPPPPLRQPPSTWTCRRQNLCPFPWWHKESKVKYLNSFPCKLGSGGTILKHSGLVDLDETFVIVKSHLGCNTRTTGATVHLRAGLHQLKPDYINNPGVCSVSLSVSTTPCFIHLIKWKNVFLVVLVKYLSLGEHAHIGSGLRWIIVFAVGEDGPVEESQIITAWVVQLHLWEKWSNNLWN